MPLGAAGDDDFAFDGRFAGFAARGEEFVEVEVAVEAECWVAVFEFLGAEVVLGHAALAGKGEALLVGLDAGEAVGALGVGFRVEGYELEVCVALVADEAGWVETFACGAEDAAGDGEGAVCAEDVGAAEGGWGVVGCGLGEGAASRVVREGAAGCASW